MKKNKPIIYVVVGIAVILAVLGVYKVTSSDTSKENITVESTTKESESSSEEVDRNVIPEMKDSEGNVINGTDEKYYTNLEKITSTELWKKLDSGEKFYLYVGRPTCQDCRVYLPLQKKVLEKLNKKIYYLDTDDEKNSEKQLDLFTKFLDTTGVNEVPTLMYVQKGDSVTFEEPQVSVYTSQDTTELEAFLTNK